MIIKILINSKTIKDNININNINPSLAYILSISTVLLISFYIFLPSISEALYLITI